MYVSLIGTGLLGSSMALRLLKAGHHLVVYNRTIAKAKPLEKKGALLAQSLKSAIAKAECIILVLSDARAIEEVLFHEDQVSLENRTIIQMGTIAPRESIEIQKKVFKLGGEYLECPVLGSRREAEQGELILLVGAADEKFEAWKDFLKVFGPQPRLIGPVGKAAALKLALNQLIAAHAMSFALSLGIITKNDIDVNVYMDILRDSALYTLMADKKLKNWMATSYEDPNFTTQHLLKDVNLVLQESQGQGLQTTVLEAIKRVLEQAVQDGWSDKDYSSVYEIIKKQ